MTLTAINLVRESPTALQRMEDQYREALARTQEGLAAIQEAIVLQDSTLPLTSDQRRALFASFRDVFGEDARQGARYVFTRLVLGYDPTVAVSWSEWKNGRLNRGEASKVLSSLSDLADAL